jgi:hypothetical protein
MLVQTKSETTQISITDLRFVSLADINLQKRIFEWDRPGDR